MLTALINRRLKKRNKICDILYTGEYESLIHDAPCNVNSDFTVLKQVPARPQSSLSVCAFAKHLTSAGPRYRSLHRAALCVG
jgi:hypothetical protein